jgi:hypothetical protein
MYDKHKIINKGKYYNINIVTKKYMLITFINCFKFINYYMYDSY